jgi:regulator of sirC expression with transglutaminase-like and TPR domain
LKTSFGRGNVMSMTNNPELDAIAQRLRVLVDQPAGKAGLAEGALLIAKSNYPELSLSHYLDRLERIAEAIARRLPAGTEVLSAIEQINAHLFGELGFTGNGQDYHNPRNSYLNDVLDQRRGIPITLSVLYMEVARQLGILVEGVSFPGHFLVIHDSPRGRLVIDPFHGGATLDYQDLRERLSVVMGEKAWSDELDVDGLLHGADRRTILVRMLRNLKGVYAHHEQWDRSLEWVNLILELEPANPEELRDRGIILEKLDCYRAAAIDYEAYLHARPSAKDRQQIAHRLQRVQGEARRLN